MLFSDVITLISEKTVGQDADGYKKIQETRREVYADVQSVKRSEFFEALKAGVKEVIAFQVSCHDYKNEKILEYDGIRYHVERSYRTNPDMMELNCSEVTRP